MRTSIGTSTSTSTGRRLAARMTTAGALGAAAALLAGCAAASPRTEPAPDEGERMVAAPAAGVQPSGEPTELATGLDVPWSIVPLDDGSALVSERDAARIVHVPAGGGEPVAVGDVEGAAPAGEGGLLGIALLPAEGAGADADPWLYAYVTTADDNRIVRMPLVGGAGLDDDAQAADLALGEQEVVLDGIPRAGTHNGGRLAFGPDGMLYATTGDAQTPDSSQDAASLAGKILRLEPDGAVPADNPTAGSPVFTLGHRNPQGITWDAEGTMWAAEFGQSTWDELNRIEPGANYGWPVVEGVVGDERYVDPVVQWATSDASPSGLTHVDGTLFLAALRGERLWALYPDAAGETAEAVPYFEGEFGRLRDAVPAPDGGLWVITNNTSNGEPRDGDDRLLHVPLNPLAEG